MRQSILEEFPEADIRVAIVWVEALKADNAEAARKSAEIFNDPRVRQFHDPQRIASRILAKDVNMPSIADLVEKLGRPRERFEASFQKGYVDGGAAAFDIFMFYEAGGTWDERPPKPFDWMTQLDPDAFLGIERSRFHFGEDLFKQLKESMRKLSSKPTEAPAPASQPSRTP